MKCDQSTTACAAPTSFASSALSNEEGELDVPGAPLGQGVRRPVDASRAANGRLPERPSSGDPALAGGHGDLEPDPVRASLEARRRAAQLLRTLLEESALLESRLADTGRLDPIRAVSGRSAMDRAIESTRSMIGSMDRLLRRQMLADGGR